MSGSRKSVQHNSAAPTPTTTRKIGGRPAIRLGVSRCLSPLRLNSAMNIEQGVDKVEDMDGASRKYPFVCAGDFVREEF
jgi:hypothetical protein